MCAGAAGSRGAFETGCGAAAGAGERPGEAPRPRGAPGPAALVQGRGGGSWQSSVAVGPLGPPREVTLPLRPRSTAALAHAPGVTHPQGGGVRGVRVPGRRGKRSGHGGDTAPSHSPHSRCARKERLPAAGRSFLPYRGRRAGLGSALPGVSLPRMFSRGSRGLSSPRHYASRAEQLREWRQPCSLSIAARGRVGDGLPFRGAWPEGAFHLVGPVSRPKRAEPHGPGFPVPPDPCARLSLLLVGSINNPCACGLFPA